MLIPKKVRHTVFQYLFTEGVLVTKKDLRSTHEPTDCPNLFVIKLMHSLLSRKYVRESFTWNHYYWYLENEGIDYLREFLHVGEDVVPATLKKRQQPDRPQGGGRGYGGDRFGGPPGRRPGFGDKEAGSGEFRPSFRSGGPRRGPPGQPATEGQ